MNALAKLIWAMIALLLFSFAALAVNQSAVPLRFLVWETPRISLFWWLLLAFVGGFVLASFGYGLVSLRARLRRRKLDRRLNEAEQELQRLRTNALDG